MRGDTPTSQYCSEQEPGVWDLQPEGLGHSPFTKWDIWGGLLVLGLSFLNCKKIIMPSPEDAG